MKKFISEFKEFIDRGSVMDMAVGIIIGSAFTNIVNALINNIITPIINVITGSGKAVGGLTLTIPGTDQVLNFSAFISAVINFLTIALVVFLLLKGFNKSREMTEHMLKVQKEEAPKPRTCPYCTQEVSDDALRCPHCTSILPGASKEQVDAMEGK